MIYIHPERQTQELHMARYKLVDRSPKFIPIVLDAQIQPGSFEYALDYLVDHRA
jgi:hypothetical protein